MTEVPPRLPPRDSGDAWVEGPDGRRYWGRYGAAGLLVHDEGAGILLQHRAEWSHFGGTWGLPGGARHEGETAVAGAIREAGEEAGVPADALQIAVTSTLDLGYWSYVTVLARTTRFFEPSIGDAESLELRWVPVEEVDGLPLHPGFGSAWPLLRGRLDERIRVVVDAANVVGSRPDGWWKDRRGANEALLARISRLNATGVASSEFGAAAGRSWPAFTVVVEGQARDAAVPVPEAGSLVPALDVVRAAGSGDDTIVDSVVDLVRAGPPATTIVVTADRALARRVEEFGAEVRGPGWLLTLLDGLPGGPPDGLPGA
ncbi:NUDIX domain-containing protein [Herbiconiux daphne]|uniref:NUDIX domain-containing protein n=1 Tax=Herbiconiux daphne TaxID=2970914 RepID=A0ABT2H114_9MICO|nr:NUDIX domain-containing protein [Herbiconiux daphne]MCS5733620.1 NUDIX domain-containing protein [Herbiconiux daphne]